MAALSLFLVVTGGTAFAVVAANQVNSESIINGEVKNPDLAANSIGTGKVVDDTLTGADINEARLGPVPNADRLGGQPASAFVPRCGQTAAQGGAIHGFAHIVVDELVPYDHQSTGDARYHTDGVHVSYNCSGGPVKAFRVSDTLVDVKFFDQPAKLAFITPTTGPTTIWAYRAPLEVGAFSVLSREKMTDFNILLP
jgi:hypothetical protein